MGNLRGRLRRLGRELGETLIVVEHEDGTTTRYRDTELFPGCLLHETSRWRRVFRGEEPLGENEIIRGLRERSGPGTREARP